MYEADKNWPGLFCGRRVPFDIKVIFLGFLAILIFVGGIQVIHIFTGEQYLVSRGLHTLFSSLGPTAAKGFNTIYQLTPGDKAPIDLLQKAPHWKALLAFVFWSILICSLFGGAISRLVAIRIAKDDTISVFKAIKFAFKHKYSLFVTPFGIALIIAFFYGCNWLAGYLAKIIPTAGPIIFIPVFLLVIISTIFIILLSILFFFGYHLIVSAIGSEGCDGLEGGINVFNYIYARPWSYLVYNALLVVSVVFLLWIGGVFIDLAFESSLISSDTVTIQTQGGEPKAAQLVSYKFHPLWKTVDVSYKFLDPEIPPQQIKYYLDQEMFEKAHKSYKKGSQSREPQMYEAGMSDVWAYTRGKLTQSWIFDPAKNQTVETQHPMTLTDFWHLDKFWACIGGILAAFYFILQYGVFGYVFAYVFAASTTIYFLMRKEVDQTDFEEIYEEEEEPAVVPKKEVKKPEEKKVEPKKEETKPGEVKKPEEKKEEPKKDEKKPEEKKAEPKKEEPKPGEVKKPEEKKEEPKKDEKKPEEKKVEPKKEETKPGEVKKPEEKKEEPKKDEKKPEEPKPGEVKKLEEKKEEPKPGEVKKPEEKKEEPKKEEPKPGEVKKPEEKKEEPKPDEVKKPEEKKEEPKKDEKKPEDSKPDEAKKPEEKKEEPKPEHSEETEDEKKKASSVDSGTMAIPLIKRKNIEKKGLTPTKKDFMD